MRAVRFEGVRMLAHGASDALLLSSYLNLRDDVLDPFS